MILCRYQHHHNLYHYYYYYFHSKFYLWWEENAWSNEWLKKWMNEFMIDGRRICDYSNSIVSEFFCIHFVFPLSFSFRWCIFIGKINCNCSHWTFGTFLQLHFSFIVRWMGDSIWCLISSYHSIDSISIWLTFTNTFILWYPFRVG